MAKFLPKDRLRWATLVRRDARFNPVEHSIAAELANRANEDGATWVGKTRLAKDLTCSTRTVQRGFSKLKKLGYLSAKARLGFTSIHTLLIPEDSAVLSSGQTGPAPQDEGVSQTYCEPNKNQPNPVQSFVAPGRFKSRSISEIALAHRLGPNGFQVLERLKYWQVAQLIRKLNEGRLTEKDLIAVRTAHRIA